MYNIFSVQVYNIYIYVYVVYGTAQLVRVGPNIKFVYCCRSPPLSARHNHPSCIRYTRYNIYRIPGIYLPTLWVFENGLSTCTSPTPTTAVVHKWSINIATVPQKLVRYTSCTRNRVVIHVYMYTVHACTHYVCMRVRVYIVCLCACVFTVYTE